MIETTQQDRALHNRDLERYYRLHSHFYDWTRWSFLFGREELLNRLPDLPAYPRILEVGCGTGKNINSLEFLFPDAEIIGIDLSEEMIRKARSKIYNNKRVQLIHGAYGSDDMSFEPFDLILLSYSLTMFGDELETILQQLYSDLNYRGHVAVVDFHTTSFNWFKRWMAVNHVNLDGHLLPLLRKFFTPTHLHIKKAYFGLWKYMFFIGGRG